LQFETLSRLRGVLILGPESAYTRRLRHCQPKATTRSTDMRRTFAYCRALFLLALPAAVLAARVGEPAPNFTATDSNGKTHSLADYRGKFVVLEWHNQGCPSQKHYQSGNMQRLQKEWVQKGVVWLTVISSAPGTQGYVRVMLKCMPRRQPRCSIRPGPWGTFTAQRRRLTCFSSIPMGH
jgi:AhpC/TSA family protein